MSKPNRKEREQLFRNTYNELLRLIPDKSKEVIAAMTSQLMIESSWGTSDLTRLHNNWGGIKTGVSWTGRAFKNPLDNLTYRSYDSFQHFALDFYHNVLQNGHHEEAMQAKTARDYAVGLMVGPTTYATNPGYPDLIMEIYEDYTSNMDIAKVSESETSYKYTPPLQSDAILLTRADILKLETYHNEIAAANRKIANIWGSKL